MNAVSAVVALAAGAAIAWELWFFLARRPDAPARTGRTAQEVRVTVRGGFHPDLILVEAGQPVRLLFYRAESAPRSERVVFDSMDIDKTLTEFGITPVEFTPTDPGDYAFHCGAGPAWRGRVVAQIGGEGARANWGRGHLKHG